MLSPGLKLLQVLLSILGAEARIKYAYRWVRTVQSVPPPTSTGTGTVGLQAKSAESPALKLLLAVYFVSPDSSKLLNLK